jgi:hypothetical protein
MNGNDPVRSWYTIPLFLSANAPNTNTFAMDPSLSSTIRVGRCGLYSDEDCSENITDVCSELSLPLNTGCSGTTTSGCVAFCRGVVLLIPWRGRFICPFAVAGLGFKYLRINFTLTFGHPSRNPFRTALSIVEIFGLHNDWCANFTAFTLVLIECVNPAIDWCGARPIQGPGRGRVAYAYNYASPSGFGYAYEYASPSGFGYAYEYASPSGFGYAYEYAPPGPTGSVTVGSGS